MGDLRGGLEGAGFHEGGAKQRETSETAERQRVLQLLSNPANKFRMEQDYSYESDSRLNPQSPDRKPFGQILLEDWETLVSDQKTDKIFEQDLERSWLSPLSKEEIGNTLQGWIDATSKPEEKADRVAYKERFLASVDSYDRQQKAAQEIAMTQVSANSRLYRDYAGEYFNNSSGLQDRFANVKDYLRAVLDEMQNGSLSLPKGCKTPADMLSPFWQTQSVETDKHNQVFLGSRLGLEYGVRFYDNPQSKMLSHVAGNLSAKKREFSGTDLESVSLDQIYGSLKSYVKQAADRLESGEINLPEGAENLAEALRPLSQEELDRWFKEQGIEENHPFRKFLSTGFEAPEHGMPDSDVEVGTDLLHHQERWQKQASRPVSYHPPLDSGNVDVPQNVAKDFGYKEGDVAREGRAFRAEAAANLRDLKFEPLRPDGVLRLSCVVDVNEQGTLRPRRLDIYVNLPKEAIVAYGEDPSAVQQVLADLLQVNESSKHPDLKYNPQADRLEIGLGDDEHLNVIVSMSALNLRQAVPQMAGEVNDYVARKQAGRLAPDERQKMWQFENELLKIWQENGNGQQVELRQKIWDDAFAKLFRQRIGEQKFAELGAAERSVRSAEPQSRPPAGERTSVQTETRRVTSRLREAREIMDTPEMRQKAVKFLEVIKSKYGGWEEFLQYAGNVLDVAHRKEVDLNSAPAYVILGREILRMPERAAGLKEYEKLSRLSLEEILRQNLFSLPEGAKVNKPNVLRYSLLKNIKENPLPSDTWDRAGLGISPGAGRISSDVVRPPRLASAERQPTRVDPSDALRKISARNQKRLDRRPYNPDNDPEAQAGII